MDSMIQTGDLLCWIGSPVNKVIHQKNGHEIIFDCILFLPFGPTRLNNFLAYIIQCKIIEKNNT